MGESLRLNVLFASLGLGLVVLSRMLLGGWEVDALETLRVVLILPHNQSELLTVQHG